MADDITAQGVLTTGFLGCNLILPTLSQIGRDDLAWQLLSNEKFPSWLFSVNQGATTIWERWDAWTPENGFKDEGANSLNHYAYGSCGQWMYARIGAIDTVEDSPGFKQLLIDPLLAPGLTSGQAKLQTLHGEAKSEWKRKGNQHVLQVVIPPNRPGSPARRIYAGRCRQIPHRPHPQRPNPPTLARRTLSPHKHSPHLNFRNFGSLGAFLWYRRHRR
jgi:alpha-L-rhamnosidase